MTLDDKSLTNDKRQTLTNDKRTTLNLNYRCDNCGEPAMTKDEGMLRCPSCWLKEKRELVKIRIDRGGYYP
jgi:DNA-directed RNA polymerase subunit RPC12/RpoP